MMISLLKRVVINEKLIKTVKNQCNSFNFSTISEIKLQNNVLITPTFSNLQFIRKKGDKIRKKAETSESESEKSSADYLDDITDKNTKTLKINVNSMRVDAILKSGLGIARNKIETIFYDSKIRLNGEKVLKKSANVSEGDEVDIIKGVNIKNPEFLYVARVEIISATNKGETISVKIRRSKSLMVENYKEKWTPSN